VRPRRREEVLAEHGEQERSHEREQRAHDESAQHDSRPVERARVRSRARSLAAVDRRPAVRILGVSGALDADDAESLPGRSAHHDPALEAADDLGAQLLEAGYLGRDVVGFDVEVDPALVLDPLDLHDGFVRRRLQHAVVAARAGVGGVHGATQGPGPEPGSPIDVGRVAVDQQGTESGMVHGAPPRMTYACAAWPSAETTCA
jgi:hypothetical protein